MKPDADRSDLWDGVPPHSVPQQMPDRKETRETVLYGPRGEALVVKVPRPFGFRPERIKEKP
jgi:hypothetical protein